MDSKHCRIDRSEKTERVRWKAKVSSPSYHFSTAMASEKSQGSPSLSKHPSPTSSNHQSPAPSNQFPDDIASHSTTLDTSSLDHLLVRQRNRADWLQGHDQERLQRKMQKAFFSPPCTCRKCDPTGHLHPEACERDHEKSHLTIEPGKPMMLK